MTACAERVSRDDGSSLREAIALQHRHTYGVEEALQLRVEQCTTTHEELDIATKACAYLLEENLIEQRNQRLEDKAPALALVKTILIILVGNLQRELKELLHLGALLLDRCLDRLTEILCQSGNRQQHVGLNLLDVDGYILQRLHRCAANLRSGYRCTTRHHNVETCYVRKAVVQRQDDKHRIVRWNRNTSQGLLYVGCIVTVCEDYALGVGSST